MALKSLSQQPGSRTPSYRHSRERGNPVPFVRERLKSLDSRVRGNDEQKANASSKSKSGSKSKIKRLKLPPWS
ncbi:hypothetical protein J7J66_10305, partial [Lysobacter sp. ISL-54]|nr:hypothetical protein [Lysobacter sp. ISL-54]